MDRQNREMIKKLKRLREQRILNVQQFRTLKGQVISGNIEGAEKGIRKIMKAGV